VQVTVSLLKAVIPLAVGLATVSISCSTTTVSCTVTVTLCYNNYTKNSIMNFIETHTHLTHFKDRSIDEVINRSLEVNVSKIITISCNTNEFKDCLELANKHDFIWSAIGIHPTDLGGDIESDMKYLLEKAKNPKVVAIGEIGLDYYHDNFPKDNQKGYFIKQINIAKQLNKPVIIHSRGGKNPGENEIAINDILDILKKENFNNAVMHCFSGNCNDAKNVLDFGLMISFTGIITYTSNSELKQVVKETPLNRIMLETDSPYISVKGNQKYRNEPMNIVDIAKFIAEVKSLSVEEIARATTENAERFFGI
jgi:TatD DNase family protein